MSITFSLCNREKLPAKIAAARAGCIRLSIWLSLQNFWTLCLEESCIYKGWEIVFGEAWRGKVGVVMMIMMCFLKYDAFLQSQKWDPLVNCSCKPGRKKNLCYSINKDGLSYSEPLECNPLGGQNFSLFQCFFPSQILNLNQGWTPASKFKKN